jgi:dUTPase
MTQGMKVTAVLDTGADLSLMDYNTYRTLAEPPTLQEPDFEGIKTANGEAERCLGKIALKFSINSDMYVYNNIFHILPNIPAKILLGQDFLEKYDVQIFCKNNRFSTRIGNLLPIVAHKGITIPPRVQQVVQVRVPDKTPQGSLGICVGSQTTLQLGAVLARSLVRTKGKEMPVQLLNPTDKTITIKRGVKIGQLELLDPKSTVVELEDNNEQGECANAYMCAGEEAQPAINKDLQNALSLDDCDLDVGQKSDLLKMLSKYRDVFALSSSELGCATAVKHCIITPPTEPPVKSRPYRVRPQEREIIATKIEEMLKKR